MGKRQTMKVVCSGNIKLTKSGGLKGSIKTKYKYKNEFKVGKIIVCSGKVTVPDGYNFVVRGMPVPERRGVPTKDPNCCVFKDPTKVGKTSMDVFRLSYWVEKPDPEADQVGDVDIILTPPPR